MPIKVPTLFRPMLLSGLAFACLGPQAGAQQAAAPAPAAATDLATPTFKTTVRRVVLDVVVTDADQKPVSGLTKEDFAITEDGRPQTPLSFEASGFHEGMDYEPPKLPQEPVNTFVNLPETPEKGPLYILLYDLVNMDNEDQMGITVNQHSDQIIGRQELVKFIQNKPEGSRFAIFVWSDGLHMLQGFTSDKSQLYAAIDPHSSRPHIPEVFLMGENVGRGDPHATLDVMKQLTHYLDGLPGRKNLIWFSGGFPLTLFVGKDEGPNYTEAVKTTLNLLEQNQVAIYPVDVRGVVLTNWKSNNGLSDEDLGISQANVGGQGGGATAEPASAPAGQMVSAKSAGAGGGAPLITGSYQTMDEIAKLTGGRAFYSNNHVSEELIAATETGSAYYTMTYAPSNRNYDGNLRSIHVTLAKKGYHLAYRRTYYGTDTDTAARPAVEQASVTGDAASTTAQRSANDTLDVNMRHGAPATHQLIFGAHVHAVGAPAKGTPEQMAQLATQPAYLKAGKKTLSPIPLQKFVIDYTVMAHQLHLQDAHSPLDLEIAAAAYDSDGKMLNGVVNQAKDSGDKAAAQPTKALHIQAVMAVPLAATSIRLAVRDANTDRIGAMEIKLPLAPENQSAAADDAGKKMDGNKTN
jgi:VWFA-related protein